KNNLDTKYIVQPVWEGRPDMIEFYWAAWQEAWNHILYQDNVTQSPYMDEGFWRNTIWIWDTEFMALFCKYAYKSFPGIQSLDNFYGPILDGHKTSLRIQHPDNPPFYPWVESEYYKMTNDKKRIKK